MTTQQKIINFFLRYPDAFVRMTSEFYSFQPHEIEKHFEQLDAKWLSRNPNCQWDLATLYLFKGQLDWCLFSRYSTAFGDAKLIEEFKTEIAWTDCNDKEGDYELTFNPNVPWSDHFIERYENYLDFRKLSWCRSVRWSEELIERYFDRWDWYALSANEKLPWSEAFIIKYENLWNWESVIYLNDCFPWSVALAKRYFQKLEEVGKDALLDNGILWNNPEIVEAFADYVDWKRISRRSSLPWHEQNLRERWKDRLKGYHFAANDAFISDPDFFEENLELYLADPTAAFSWLSFRTVLPWSIPFIERFKEYWGWDFLSTNEGLPWSMELVDQYLDRWSWGRDLRTADNDMPRNSGLINNGAIPWDIDWILKYDVFIDIKSLSLEPMIWEKAFRPYVDEKMVDTIFRLI